MGSGGSGVGSNQGVGSNLVPSQGTGSSTNQGTSGYGGQSLAQSAAPGTTLNSNPITPTTATSLPGGGGNVWSGPSGTPAWANNQPSIATGTTSAPGISYAPGGGYNPGSGSTPINFNGQTYNIPSNTRLSNLGTGPGQFTPAQLPPWGLPSYGPGNPAPWQGGVMAGLDSSGQVDPSHPDRVIGGPQGYSQHQAQAAMMQPGATAANWQTFLGPNGWQPDANEGAHANIPAPNTNQTPTWLQGNNQAPLPAGWSSGISPESLAEYGAGGTPYSGPPGSLGPVAPQPNPGFQVGPNYSLAAAEGLDYPGAPAPYTTTRAQQLAAYGSYGPNDSAASPASSPPGTIAGR